MESFSSYKKNELLGIANSLGLEVSQRMKKAEIISLITGKNPKLNSVTKKQLSFPSEDLTNSKSTKNKDSKIPLEDIVVIEDRRIVLLSQSDKNILVIWNADDSINEETKAWKISNESSLDILLPAYARSIFLDKNQLSNQILSVSRILYNDELVLYAECLSTNLDSYTNLEVLSKSELEDLKMTHFNSYNENLFSSDNHFQ